MTPEQHQAKIDNLFHEACELPLDQRRSFLDEACKNDDALRKEVEKLLEADQQLEDQEQLFDAAPLDQLQDQLRQAAQHSLRQPAGRADENLLFGIIALQLNFVDKDQLIQAMHEWVRDKSRSIGEIFLAHGHLESDTHSLLVALVHKHLELHEHDLQQSIASLSSASLIINDLKQIDDDELKRSVTVIDVQSNPTDTSDSTLTLGNDSSTAGRFRVLRPHGKGGLGVVSIAQDSELNREVAIKEIQKDIADHPEARGRFLVEAEVTGGLEHPGVVPVYGLGSFDDGRPFYVMRFIKGENLEQAIKHFRANKPSMTRAECNIEMRKLLRRFIDVCDAISYAHDRKVLHRDLKPGNIMLGKYGETLVVDWGLAKLVDPGDQTLKASYPEVSNTETTPLKISSGSNEFQTSAGSVTGTPRFMSPEQAGGKVDELGPATDIYSLGATLYYLLTGQAPVTERKREVVLEQVRKGRINEPRKVDVDVPRPLEAICLKAMKLHPQDRYQNPVQLADDIEHWLADERVSVYADPIMVRFGRFCRHHKTLVSGVAVGLLTAIFALAISFIVVQNKNRELGVLNAKLESSNSELEVANHFLQQDFDSTRQLSFELIDRAEGSEDSLAQIPGAQQHRYWITNRALEIFKPLQDRHQQDSRIKYELAKLYRFAASLDRHNKDFDDSTEKYSSAIKLLDELVELDPDNNDARDLLAISLSDLVPVLRRSGKLNQGKSVLEEAESIMQNLRDSFPNELNYVLTDALIQMEYAVVLYESDEADAALQRSKKCAELFDLLVDHKIPDSVHDILLVLAWSRQTLILYDLERFKEAESVAREGIRRFAADFEASPMRGRRHAMARLKLQLAIVLQNQSPEHKEAAELLDNSRAIWEAMVKDFPESSTYPPYLARTYLAIALSHAAQNENQQARTLFQSAQKTVLDSLEKKQTTIALETAALICTEFAKFETQIGNDRAAKKHLDAAKQHIQKACALNPENERLKRLMHLQDQM